MKFPPELIFDLFNGCPPPGRIILRLISFIREREKNAFYAAHMKKAEGMGRDLYPEYVDKYKTFEDYLKEQDENNN